MALGRGGAAAECELDELADSEDEDEDDDEDDACDDPARESVR